MNEAVEHCRRHLLISIRKKVAADLFANNLIESYNGEKLTLSTEAAKAINHLWSVNCVR
jgi:hypothetical protein